MTPAENVGAYALPETAILHCQPPATGCLPNRSDPDAFVSSCSLFLFVDCDFLLDSVNLLFCPLSCPSVWIRSPVPVIGSPFMPDLNQPIDVITARPIASVQPDS